MRGRRFLRSGGAGAGLVVLAAACTGSSATDDPALGARMRIAGGQFVSGPFPAPVSGAPSVAAIDLQTNTIWAGEPDKTIAGALDPSATAAAIALSSDEGYWIVPAGPPDFSAPAQPTFQAAASFSTTLAPGAYTLEVHAVDANGAFGPPSRQILTALSGSPASTPPQAQLVVTLDWDTESDLDLHVVDPSGNEIYHGNTETFDGDGGIAGELLFDSNANCIIDGRREEDVVWQGPPPSGHYLVRVDTPSLCGQPIANWTVRVVLRGSSLGEASGVSVDSDTWGPHDRGAGLLALQFDVP
jgi:hypothetical protein